MIDLPVHRLFIGPDHPPGCSPDHVRGLVAGTIRDDRPVTVKPHPAGLYEITNGRHRYLRAVIRGDALVQCEVDA